MLGLPHGTRKGKGGERPIRPGAATGLALARHVGGYTPELREARHAALLAATPLAIPDARHLPLEATRPIGFLLLAGLVGYFGFSL